MAGALYDSGRQLFLGSTASDAQIDFRSHNIKATLISSSYTPNLGSHVYVTSIHGHTGSVSGTAQTLASKTTTAGVADADDVTFLTVPVGMVIDYVALFKDTGQPNNSPLICVISGAIGMPLTGSGGDITVQWNNGSNRIFKL